MTSFVKQISLTKIAAALVGVAMVAGLGVSFAAERAHAVTLSELVQLFIALDIIPADKAAQALSVVQQQETTGGTTGGAMTGGTTSCNFTANLKVGSTGPDVMALQKFLNTNPDTVVAASGAGSTGMESSYYGPKTASAVSRFQEKYAADILTPLGLSKGTGYFGASTRAKANTLCGSASTPTTPGVPGAPGIPGVPGTGTTSTTTTDTGNTGTITTNTEATLGALKLLSSPSNIDLAEGDSAVKVAGFSTKVTDGDASLQRVDVNFEATAGNSNYTDRPWKIFKKVAIYLGDTKLGEQTVDSEGDWTDLSSSNAYQLRFTGLNGVIKKDQTGEIYVVVTAASAFDTADENTTWTVTIPNNGVRARDGAGLDQYTSDGSVSRTFSTEGAGSGEKLKVLTDSSNPDASTIQADENTQTKDVTILTFDLQAKDHDIQLTKFPVTIKTASSSLSHILSDLKLQVGGKTYNIVDPTLSAATKATSTGTSTTFSFDLSDDKLNLTKDETVTAKVIVSLNQQKNNYWATGEALTASVPTLSYANTGAYGANNISDFSGTIDGNQQSILTSGIFLQINSKDASVRTINNGTEDVADFTVKFDATAFSDTYYVGSTTASVVYDVLKDGAVVSTSSTAALTFGDTAESNGNFRINDGATKTFTFKVTVNPAVPGYYAIRVNSVKYSLTNAGTVNDLTASATPSDDFKTAQVNISQ